MFCKTRGFKTALCIPRAGYARVLIIAEHVVGLSVAVCGGGSTRFLELVFQNVSRGNRHLEGVHSRIVLPMMNGRNPIDYCAI